MEQLTSKSTQFDNAYKHHQIMTFAQFITERQMVNAYESQITAILDTLGKEGYTFKRTTQTGSIIKIFTKRQNKKHTSMFSIFNKLILH